MPPGSDVDKLGTKVLRNGVTASSTRARHPTAIPAARRSTWKMIQAQKRRSAEAAAAAKAAEQLGTSENSQNLGNSTKKPQKKAHSSAEIYSKKLYRQIAAGYDMDGDSDTELPGTSLQAVISDSWKQEYSYGNQELARPHEIPASEVDDDGFVLEEKYDFKLPEKLIVCDVDAAYVADETVFLSPPITPPAYCYEITAQDEVFIQKLNKDRLLSSGVPYLNVEKFEKIMRCLEEQVFLNIHNELLDDLHVAYTRPPEGGTEDEAQVECDVCRISECDEHDEMIFCDMCNSCVHMLCAGIEHLPPAQDPWKCKKCAITGSTCPPCHLCPTLGGSMACDEKQEVWAHHVCALFHPEVHFGNEETREPIEEIELILPERWTELCSVCDTRRGACIECVEPGCEVKFHVGCALRAGLTVRIVEDELDVRRLTYCYKHSAEHESWRMTIQEQFKNCDNPWMAQLLHRFYLMVAYEQVAEMLNLDEIIVSDVYEYWKQKRLAQNNEPLIPNLTEHIKTESTILRAAKKSAEKLEKQLKSSSESSPSFFPAAALMVTELRQHHLKRVRDAMELDVKMVENVLKREKLKCQLVQTEAQSLRLAAQMSKIGNLDPEMLIEMWKIPREQVEKAQSAEHFEKICKRLEMPPKKVGNPQFHWPRQDLASSGAIGTSSRLSTSSGKSSGGFTSSRMSSGVLTPSGTSSRALTSSGSSSGVLTSSGATGTSSSHLTSSGNSSGGLTSSRRPSGVLTSSGGTSRRLTSSGANSRPLTSYGFTGTSSGATSRAPTSSRMNSGALTSSGGTSGGPTSSRTSSGSSSRPLTSSGATGTSSRAPTSSRMSSGDHTSSGSTGTSSRHLTSSATPSGTATSSRTSSGPTSRASTSSGAKKSPLRPRNLQNPAKMEEVTPKRRAGRARPLPIGNVQKTPTKYLRRGRPTKEQQLNQMLQEMTPPPSSNPPNLPFSPPFNPLLSSVTPPPPPLREVTPSKSAPTSSKKLEMVRMRRCRQRLRPSDIRNRRKSFPPF